MRRSNIEQIRKKVNQMRDEYDFSAGIKNPYAKKLKKSRVTINLDTIVIEYFKDLPKRQ